MSGGNSANNGAVPVTPPVHLDQLGEGELERLLLAAQEDATLLCGPDTLIHYVSPSIETLMGYRPGDLTGRSFADFIHPEDLAVLAADWQRFNDGLEDDPAQFRARRKDGSWGWYEARAGHIPDGRLPGCASVTLREVEHHHRLRARIAAAETMARIGSWRWMIENGEPEWTSSMYRLLGYEPREGALDLHWAFNLIHEEERDQFRESILECLDNPRSFTLTTRMKASDGAYRSIIHHCYAERDRNGEVLALIGICQDITAQTEAEQALCKSERAYRTLTEEASDVIFSVEASGQCSFVSPACFRTLGYRPDEMIGEKLLDFAHESDHAEILTVNKRAREGREAQRVTFRAHHKLGDTIWMEAGVRPVTDENGTFTELVVVARDITERREYEEGLRRAREKAEAANITKSQFLANMSHELRTPLNAVLGFSDIMKEEMFGPLGSEQYRDYIRLIHESGQFLLDLINDILDMSKIEAGKYELFVEDIHLDQMIEGCLRIMEPRAGNRGVALDRKVPEGLPPVAADERAVKQILLNLLSNAVKFTDAGGAVRVSVEHGGDHALVRVTDTGCGIPEYELPRLGKPFEQVMSDANLAKKGTGLGLALVKSFVEMHDGTLSIESCEGEGTNITFTLPFEAAAQTKSA